MSTKLEIKAFCQNIKTLRKNYYLSKKSMAKLLDIGIASLNKIESGVLPPRLSCELLVKIHTVFNVPPKVMFIKDMMNED